MAKQELSDCTHMPMIFMRMAFTVNIQLTRIELQWMAVYIKTLFTCIFSNFIKYGFLELTKGFFVRKALPAHKGGIKIATQRI